VSAEHTRSVRVLLIVLTIKAWKNYQGVYCVCMVTFSWRSYR